MYTENYYIANIKKWRSCDSKLPFAFTLYLRDDGSVGVKK